LTDRIKEATLSAPCYNLEHMDTIYLVGKVFLSLAFPKVNVFREHKYDIKELATIRITAT
jgi:hypothetical protein